MNDTDEIRQLESAARQVFGLKPSRGSRNRPRRKPLRARERPRPAQWPDGEVMTFSEAAAVFFPHGPGEETLRASTVGRLVAGGHQLTTAGMVREWLRSHEQTKAAA
jgi:hypothetical protein